MEINILVKWWFSIIAMVKGCKMSSGILVSDWSLAQVLYQQDKKLTLCARSVTLRVKWKH